MTRDEALLVADRFADPQDASLPVNASWWRQSLAYGVPGIVLLHAEAAAMGLRPWGRVSVWLKSAGPKLSGGEGVGAYYGAPAVAHAMTGVASVMPGSYREAMRLLDNRIAALAVRRINDAIRRLRARKLPELAEFDTVRGLAGLGRHLLRRQPAGDAINEVLSYLVWLTAPLEDEQGSVPGWWTPTGPAGRLDGRFPGGHGNVGMAHGIGGVLALLSLAQIQGITVSGQNQAIADICAWLDKYSLTSEYGARWPYMVDRPEHTADTVPQALKRHGVSRRPSWCYGTAGLARAQQLAALAITDVERQRTAEIAMAGALRDPVQRKATVDASLCHGTAGLARIAARMAEDAHSDLAAELRAYIPELLDSGAPPADLDAGWLEGHVGTALATLTPFGAPATGWDSCLLIA